MDEPIPVGGRVRLSIRFLDFNGNIIAPPSPVENYKFGVSSELEYNETGQVSNTSPLFAQSGLVSGDVVTFSKNTRFELQIPPSPIGFFFDNYLVSGGGANSGYSSDSSFNIFDNDEIEIVAVYRKQQPETSSELPADDTEKVEPKGGYLQYRVKFFDNGQVVTPPPTVQDYVEVDVEGSDGRQVTLNLSTSYNFDSPSNITFTPVNPFLILNVGSTGEEWELLNPNETVSYNQEDLNLKRTKTLTLEYSLKKIPTVPPESPQPQPPSPTPTPLDPVELYALFRVQAVYFDSETGNVIPAPEGGPKEVLITSTDPVNSEFGISDSFNIPIGPFIKIYSIGTLKVQDFPFSFNYGGYTYTYREIQQYPLRNPITYNDIMNRKSDTVKIFYDRSPAPEFNIEGELKVTIKYFNSQGERVFPFENNPKSIIVNATGLYGTKTKELKDFPGTPVGTIESYTIPFGTSNIELTGYKNSFEFQGNNFVLETENPFNIPTSIGSSHNVDIIYKEVIPDTKPVTFEDIKVNVFFEPLVNTQTPIDIVRFNGAPSPGVSVLSSGNQVVRKRVSNDSETYTISFSPYEGYTTPDSVYGAKSGDVIDVTYIQETVDVQSVLNITTKYNPSLPSNLSEGKIIVNGDEKGEGSVILKLDPGEYNITFGDINSSNIVYQTPEPVRVVLGENENKSVVGTYSGKFIPSSYWLKPINSIDSKHYVFEKIEGLFSGGIKNLTTFFTSSLTASMDNYANYVYQDNPSITTSSIQFSVTYGHYLGYGSDNSDNNDPNITPTKAIYGQYRSKILENKDSKFNFNGKDADSIYIINYQHERLQQALDFGAFEINLSYLSGSEFVSGGSSLSTHTGSNVTLSGDGSVLRLIADSSSYDVDVYGRSYDIVSGTIEDGIYNESSKQVFGKMYIDHGAVILDGDKLDDTASFGTVDEREVNGENYNKLYLSISGAAQYTDDSGDLLGMKARRKVLEFNDYYFIKAGSKEFNRSNNSTYYSAPDGSIIDNSIKDTSITYITTIGLYNDNRELIAVGKLSKPIKKDSTTERLFKVKLKH